MRKQWCILLGVVVGLLAVSTAQAQTNVNEVAGALKDTRVYVAPGVEGTNQDTTSELAAQLNDSDRVVLVMLPANGDDPGAVAQEIDKATDHKYIVGLAVGSELTAASTVMSDKVARDLMQRAVTTGTNPVERLETFARNVHEWQTDHPNEPASKEADKGGVSFALIATLISCLVAVLIGVFVLRSRLDTTPDTQEIKFKASPEEVRDILRTIQKLIPRIKDPRMKESAVQSISDTEEYFKRCVDKTSRSSETDTFVSHLTSVKDVLTHYIDIQDFQRYYNNPEVLMKKGREAIESFSEFVLKSIRNGGKSELTRFNVDTDILSAQRYR